MKKRTTLFKVLRFVFHLQAEDEHHVESETPQVNELMTETSQEQTNPLVCIHLFYFILFIFKLN